MSEETLPQPMRFSRPPQEIAEGFVQFVIDRAPDPFWHYRLALPKGVKMRPKEGLAAPSSESPLQSLGLFYREDFECDLEVLGVSLAREIDPLYWLEESLAFNGLRPESWKSLPSPGGLLGDAVATWEIEGRAFAGRFVALKFGPRLFVLLCRAERERYASIAEDFFFTLTQFGVVQDTTNACAETLAPVGAGGPMPWRLQLPASWDVTPGAADSRRASFHAELRAPGAGDRAVASAWLPFPGIEGVAEPAPLPTESYRGRLSTFIFPPNAFSAPQEAGTACVEAFREVGIEPTSGRFIAGPALPVFPETWDLDAQARHDGQEGFELRCRVARCPQAWVVSGVLSLARSINPFAWMQTRRALDLVGLTMEFPA